MIAIPIPRIPSEKKPGTIFNTVAPHVLELYKAPFVAATVAISVETGPIKDTPIIMDTNPPIKFAIILFFQPSYVKTRLSLYLKVGVRKKNWNTPQRGRLIKRFYEFGRLYIYTIPACLRDE